MSETSEQPHAFDLVDCERVLESVSPSIDDFGRTWTKFRNQAPAAGRRFFFKRVLERLARRPSTVIDQIEELRREVSSDRSLFIGKTARDIAFLGDVHDYPSVVYELDPKANTILIDALTKEFVGLSGNFVDVGTNVGIVAVTMARALSGRGSVFAFEPSPSTFNLAAGTVALNKIDNATLFQVAVTNTDTEVVFHTTPGNSAIASLRKHEFPMLNEWAEVRVQGRRLSSFLNTALTERVALIKVDVEGHELSVLEGALELIERDKPIVVYEYTPVAANSHGWSQQDSINMIQRAGNYTFEALGELDGKTLPFPLPEGYKWQVNVFARPA